MFFLKKKERKKERNKEIETDMCIYKYYYIWWGCLGGFSLGDLWVPAWPGRPLPLARGGDSGIFCPLDPGISFLFLSGVLRPPTHRTLVDILPSPTFLPNICRPSPFPRPPSSGLARRILTRKSIQPKVRVDSLINNRLALRIVSDCGGGHPGCQEGEARHGSRRGGPSP